MLSLRRRILGTAADVGLAVVWWLLFVRPAEAVPATRGCFVWLCGMTLTDTVLTWMHLDKRTRRTWGYVGMASFGIAGILYAAADAHCLVGWTATACTPDSPRAH